MVAGKDVDQMEHLKIKIRHLENLLKVAQTESRDAREKYFELYNQLDIQVKRRTEQLNRAKEKLIEKNRRLRQEQKALEASEKHIRNLFENSPDANFILDEKLRIQEFNPQAQVLLKTSERSLKGLLIIDCIDQSDRSRLKKWLRSIFMNKKINVEGSLRTKTIFEQIIEFRSNLITHKNGRQVLLVARDVSLRDKAEQSMKEAMEMAESAKRLQSEIIANMSHELRTPLNAILGFSDLLGQDEEDASKRDQLRTIYTSGENLLDQLNSLIQLAKLESGSQKVDKNIIEIRTFINQITEHYQKAYTESKVNFVTDIDDTIPHLILSDEILLEQVLRNILDNAFKFTESGSIGLSLKKLRKNKQSITVRIGIKDTGIGISAQNLEYIFMPFHQVQTGSNKKYNGPGIGLALVKKIVEVMDGKLHVESAVSKGTTFLLDLKMEIPALPKNDILPKKMPSENKPNRLVPVKDHQLGHDMHAELMNQWHQLNKTKLIDDIGEFAQKILNIDQLNDQSKLWGWAMEIKLAVDDYDIAGINRLLPRLPEMIKI